MGHIVLLALGAAVFPALLACVAILLSRPSPRRLLLAFYLGGLVVSVTCGLLILSRYHDGHPVIGSRPSAPDPSTSIVQGVLALALARLMTSSRVRARAQRRRAAHPRRERAQAGPSRLERTLSRAGVPVALLVGAAINLPGPFYLLALGDIATGSYAVGDLGLVLLFNVIMFALVEVPLAGYLVRPNRTAELVSRLSRWLNANGLRVMGWFVGVFGATLIVQGLVAL